MQNDEYNEKAELFKVLSDANRLRILKMLSEGEKCACKLLEAFNITQPTLSHHLKVLVESGLITSRKETKWIHYKLNEGKVNELIKYFQLILK